MNTEIFDLGKIGITLGGEYDNKVVYEKLTIVLYKGKSYISTKITHGVSPEQNIETWQLVAEAKDAYNMLVDAGKITLTEEEFLEQLVDATKGRYIVQGNVINTADEEDLTVEHSSLLGIDTLKLANRPSTDGMGYVILRKNKSFDEQVTKENTIYEIRYNFTLDKNITIPNNCILKFNGGSISGAYTITGTNTGIQAGFVKIFNTDVTLVGTWNVAEVYPEWFGAKGNGIADDSVAINKALSFPAIKLRLLNKVYNVLSTTQVQYNVDNTTKNANIIVPGNKIILGSSTSDYTSNSTISVSENADSDFALFISSRQVKIENIRVVSNKKNGIYSCDNLIVTQRGIAHLTLNNVHARWCNKNALDIDCFGLLFTMCSAGDCEIAYCLHGTGGNNTSATLISCAAGGSKINGYRIYNMSYSSLISCSADTCGFDRDNIDVNNINHAYCIKDSRSINLVGCGCEGCYKALQIGTDTRNVTINSCDFWLPVVSEYPTGFDFTKIIQFDSVVNCKIQNSCVGRAFSDGLIYATNKSHVVFEDCEILSKSNNSNAELIEYYITYSDESLKHVIIFNNVGKIDKTGYIATLSNYSNSRIDKYLKLSVDSGDFNNNKFENIIGKCILTTSRGEAQFCYVINENYINNCTNLCISKLKINFNSFAGTVGFIINNSTVIFDNIQFLSYHNFKTKKIFKAVNSKIIFRNCTTIPGYDSSKFIKDVIELENSIIEFDDNNIGTTTERTNYTPIYVGFEWYDTTLNKKLYWTGNTNIGDNGWVDALGNSPSATVILKSGTLVNGNVPEFDGTDGTLKDSGKAATSIP